MSSNSLDLDLKSFILPSSFHHQAQIGDGQLKTDRYGIDLTTDPRRWENWVVKLMFKKLGGKLTLLCPIQTKLT